MCALGHRALHPVIHSFESKTIIGAQILPSIQQDGFSGAVIYKTNDALGIFSHGIREQMGRVNRAREEFVRVKANMQEIKMDHIRYASSAGLVVSTELF